MGNANVGLIRGTAMRFSRYMHNVEVIAPTRLGIVVVAVICVVQVAWVSLF